MDCAEFQCECRRYQALHGEIGLGTELSRADACADHRRRCGCCAHWYRDRLAEERPLLLLVR
jgi:hypothetical protein